MVGRKEQEGNLALSAQKDQELLGSSPWGRRGQGFLSEHGFHWGWKERYTNQMMEVVGLDLQTILKELHLGFDRYASLLHLAATEDSWSQEGGASADCSGALGV
jgi:hypothetical protein